MIWEFFLQAGRSPSRQRSFRTIVALHILCLLTIVFFVIAGRRSDIFALVGDTLILLGIVEGAILVGWRLVQWPKSRALEPLLLADLSPIQVMAGEQLAGIALLGLISLSSVPVLLVLATLDWIPLFAVWFLPTQQFLYGCLVGFGLVWWAYETPTFRWWGERILGLLLITYFVVGGLVGEQTLALLRSVPFGIGNWLIDGVWTMYANHPFSLLHAWDQGADAEVSGRVFAVSRLVAAAIGLFLLRSALRLEGHYVEKHYKPVSSEAAGARGRIADEPLSWWAVRRVREYAGRINLYLAGGTSALYSAYLLAGNHWPAWIGNDIFLVFEQNGGVATFSTILVLLAAVPAAYQYGLWDTSKTDRCQRLESFLTTDLAPDDFKQASWAASWSRGRGYFYAAILLWISAACAGRITWLQVLLAIASGWLLLILYFVIAFRCLARTGNGTMIGFLLSVAVPLAVWGLVTAGWTTLARLLPPGLVYFAVADPTWMEPAALVVLSFLGLSVLLLRITLRTFDADIRRSFEADLLRI